MSELSVEASGLSKVYWDGSRRLEIFREVSLDVRRGEGVAILGRSGSGKTTLLNLLSGLDRPDSGEVRIEGQLLGAQGAGEEARFRNRNIGFVFQFYHLLPEFSATENVMLPALIAGRRGPAPRERQRAEALLERLGLKERLRHFPSQLSGGEQQRVAIARALMNDPKVLFCDEPTGNLDAATGERVAELLRSLFAEEKKTVLIVTHDEKIAALADRVWNMADRNWMHSGEKVYGA